jgi:hypothetical protein
MKPKAREECTRSFRKQVHVVYTSGTGKIQRRQRKLLPKSLSSCVRIYCYGPQERVRPVQF